MAIATIDPIVAHVMLVAELNWLLALDPLARVPARASYFCRHPKSGEQNENSAVDRGPR